MPIAVGRKVVFRAAAERELARLYQNIKESRRDQSCPSTLFAETQTGISGETAAAL